MSKSLKGRLAALIATTLFLTSHSMAQTFDVSSVDTTGVAPEEVAQFQAAMSAGEEQLVGFMTRFPQSTLVAPVISALSQLVGVERATQLALNAGVPAENAVRTAATITAQTRTATTNTTGRVDVGGDLVGAY